MVFIFNFGTLCLIEKKIENISLNQITQSIGACRDMCWSGLWSVHSVEITGAKQKIYLTSHYNTGQHWALALPNTVSFKSGSVRNRTKFLMLFYSCWYLDLTPSISQNSSVVFPASHCSDHRWEYKIVKNVEIYSNCASSRHCHAMLSDGITRVFPTFIRVGQFQHPCWDSPESTQSRLPHCTSRLPAIIVILVAAKVIWWLQLHQDLLLSVNYQSFPCS